MNGLTGIHTQSSFTEYRRLLFILLKKTNLGIKGKFPKYVNGSFFVANLINISHSNIFQKILL